MSRNPQIDYTQYVHEYTDKRGVARYAVAEYDPVHHQYTRPLDKRERELTGCHTEFGPLDYLGGYTNRVKALRRARYLFGPTD